MTENEKKNKEICRQLNDLFDSVRKTEEMCKDLLDAELGEYSENYWNSIMEITDEPGFYLSCKNDDVNMLKNDLENSLYVIFGNGYCEGDESDFALFGEYFQRTTLKKILINLITNNLYRDECIKFAVDLGYTKDITFAKRIVNNCTHNPELQKAAFQLI